MSNLNIYVHVAICLSLCGSVVAQDKADPQVFEVQIQQLTDAQSNIVSSLKDEVPGIPSNVNSDIAIQFAANILRSAIEEQQVLLPTVHRLCYRGIVPAAQFASDNAECDAVEIPWNNRQRQLRHWAEQLSMFYQNSARKRVLQNILCKNWGRDCFDGEADHGGARAISGGSNFFSGQAQAAREQREQAAIQRYLDSGSPIPKIGVRVWSAPPPPPYSEP
jgi:hypothetical protein